MSYFVPVLLEIQKSLLRACKLKVVQPKQEIVISKQG
jgi:hypothetical protein